MAIDLTIIVDTTSLPQGSQDYTHPAPVHHNIGFMMTDLTHCSAGNGTADIKLKGSVGDTLRIWGSSLSDQLNDEVFIYDFKHWKGDNVLDTVGLEQKTFKESANVPVETGNSSHQPPSVTQQTQTFYCTEIDISNAGTEYFRVYFEVYGPQTTQGRALKGYYFWDPSIMAV